MLECSPRSIRIAVSHVFTEHLGRLVWIYVTVNVGDAESNETSG